MTAIAAAIRFQHLAAKASLNARNAFNAGSYPAIIIMHQESARTLAANARKYLEAYIAQAQR